MSDDDRRAKWLTCIYCGLLSAGGYYHEQQCNAPIGYRPADDAAPEEETPTQL